MAIDLDNLVKTRIDGQGRLLIPAALREKMGLKPNGHVAMYLDEDGLHVLTTHLTIKRAQREFRQFVPEGVSLADELIADRRAEAAREDVE
jgi:AbrB family looped-hinge helix DNA binding protein